MSGYGDTGELRSLDGVLGSGVPATVYVGLFSVTPGDSGGGTEIAISRVAVPNDAGHWPAATTVSGVGTKSNGAKIDYGSTAGNTYAAVVAFGIFDGPTGGTPTVWGPLTDGSGTPTSTDISDKADVNIPTGTLIVTAD